MRTALTVLTTFAVGMFFGPVVIAAGSALHQPDPDDGWRTETEASKLVDAYQDHLEPMRLFLTIIPPEDGRECGYDPSKLFPESIMEMANARSADDFTDYEGYYALTRWAGEQNDKAYIMAIADKIDRTMPVWRQEFLRRCIDGTLFASFCMADVEHFGDKVERFPEKPYDYLIAGGHEEEIICTYLDAVAAKRGVSKTPS